MDLKPTIKQPVGDISKKYNTEFNKTMNMNDINLQETDGLLTEKEQSLKKKIFSLSKMEALVFSDPKLTSVYDEMSENGEEKYGYHYNETIMNMIFNDYVLNSPKYLQKYKMAIPKKKKRRDKSGINQLKKSAGIEIKPGLSLDNTENPEPTNETTSAGSSGAYSTPYAWGGGDLMKGKEGVVRRKPIWPGGSVIQEENYLVNPTKFNEIYNQLNEDVDRYITDNTNAFNNSQIKNWSNNDKKVELNTIKTGTMEENYGVDEYNVKVKHDNGVVTIKTSASSEEAAKTNVMKAENCPMSAILSATKINKINEENEIDPRENLETFLSFNNDDIYWKWINGEVDDSDAIMLVRDIDGIDYDPNTNYRTEYMGEDDEIDNDGSDPDERFKRVYWGDDYMLETDQSMVADTQSGTMAMKPQPAGTVSNGGIPTGLNDTSSAMSEAEFIKLHEEKLKTYINYNNALKNMNEERKQSTLVMKDRLGKENQSNFKKDLNHSGTQDTIDVEKELMWKDQQETVEDPYQLANKLEKDGSNKGKAFDNVGDSTNSNNKEIPKRNLTKDEQDEVEMYRLNLGDYVYDNKPSDKFEERMKNDMGEDLYKQRQEKLKFREKAPMYNKDPQPIENTSNTKVEYNKDKSGWNDRYGLDESMVTGKYYNGIGQANMIDFKLNEVKVLTTPTSRQTGLFKVDLSGLGNSYLNKSVNSKVIVNENVVNALNNTQFYTDGKTVFVLELKKNLNENKEEKQVINESEQLNKMKRLLNYNSNNYIDTTKTKKDRGF